RGVPMKLSVEGLNSYYGPAHILFDVALEVGDGEVVALLGRNGAGKSTTFRSIVGLVGQRTGRILFEGRDVSDQPTHAIVSRGLGYVPEERRIFTDLTVDENLEVGRQPVRPNAPHWTREKLFSLFPNLAELRSRVYHRARSHLLQRRHERTRCASGYSRRPSGVVRLGKEGRQRK